MEDEGGVNGSAPGLPNPKSQNRRPDPGFSSFGIVVREQIVTEAEGGGDQLSLSLRLCLGQRLDSFIDRLLVSG